MIVIVAQINNRAFETRETPPLMRSLSDCSIDPNHFRFKSISVYYRHRLGPDNDAHTSSVNGLIDRLVFLGITSTAGYGRRTFTMGLTTHHHYADSANTYAWVSQPKRFPGQDIMPSDSWASRGHKRFVVPEASANQELLTLLKIKTRKLTASVLSLSARQNLSLSARQNLKSSHLH